MYSKSWWSVSAVLRKICTQLPFLQKMKWAWLKWWAIVSRLLDTLQKPENSSKSHFYETLLNQFLFRKATCVSWRPFGRILFKASVYCSSLSLSKSSSSWDGFILWVGSLAPLKLTLSGSSSSGEFQLGSIGVCAGGSFDWRGRSERFLSQQKKKFPNILNIHNLLTWSWMLFYVRPNRSFIH